MRRKILKTGFSYRISAIEYNRLPQHLKFAIRYGVSIHNAKRTVSVNTIQTSRVFLGIVTAIMIQTQQDMM